MKEQIISEVQRLAKDLGCAPGKRAFENATGIKEHRWRGIYWTKWSDLLSEAGLNSNEMTSAYPNEVVMEHILDACRHFGKFPTTAELTLYARSVPGFPSEKAIRNRFPKRIELAAALREYARSNDKYVDVVDLLPEVSPVPYVAPEKVAEGFVYLLKSGAFYKIGRSDEIERRIKEIRISLPETAELIHQIRTDDPSGIEAYWHRRFQHFRLNGEWFKLGKAEVAAFRRRTYQ